MSDYKLVPVEPTSDMLCSGIDAYGIEDCLDADVHAIYTSMIGAAPAFPVDIVGWQLDLPDGRVFLEKEYPEWAGGGDGYRITPLYAHPQIPPVVQGEPIEAMNLAFELGGLDDGSYHLESEELESVIKEAIDEYAVQGEPVGEAGALRGASGFTTAVFESSKVPEGTKLYASPRHAEQQATGHDWDDQDKCRRCGDRDWYASAACTSKQQPAPDVARNQTRESAMVILERDNDGTPTVWCDPEIADLVSALNKSSIRTIASCSGHGQRPGNIVLADGRELMIARDFDEARKIDSFFPGINGEPPVANVEALIEALEDIAGTHHHSASAGEYFAKVARAAIAAHRCQVGES